MLRWELRLCRCLASQTVLADLREVIVRTTGKEPPESADVSLDYVAALCTQLIRQQNTDAQAWQQARATQNRVLGWVIVWAKVNRM